MRYIALLEFQPGLLVDIVAPHSYIENTNGTLPQETCRLRIDENGFMVSEKPLGENDDKILLLGGSALENLYIPEDQRIMSRLEEIAAQSGKGVKVYNAGITNIHLLHAVNILINKGIALRPKYLVYYMAQSLDMVANELENSFWNPADAMTPVRRSGQEITVKHLPAYPNKYGFEDERRLLRTMADICENFGIKLFIATAPLYGPHDAFTRGRPTINYTLFDQEQARTADLNQIARDICREKQCELIDLEKAFADVAHCYYFYDLNHPNAKGCDLIASLIGASLSPHL